MTNVAQGWLTRLLFAAAIISVATALLFARACEYSKFNAGWGDTAADRMHAFHWWAVIVSVLIAGTFITAAAVRSRRILYSVSSGVAVSALLVMATNWVPGQFRVALFIPQFPGFFVSLLMLGVHGNEQLFAFWMLSINAVAYSLVACGVLIRMNRNNASSVQQ